jgi:glycosyltransferase involved in cell wall biosynthesis
MKIGHYDSELWSKGGVSSYIRRVSQAQQAAGHSIHFFSIYSPQAGIEDWEIPQIVTDEVDLFHQAQALGLDILHLHKPIRTQPSNQVCVIRTVHGHQPYCPSGSKFLRRWNKPCDRPYNLYGCLWGHVVDRCGSIRPKTSQFNFQSTTWERAILPTIPTITVSQFLKDQMVAIGYPADLIRVLHLPAPESLRSELPPQDGIPHFVVAGRLTPEKGIGFLLEAVQQVTVPIHLDIAGEGYSEPELRKLVQQLNISDRVTFHGWVNAAQALDLMQKARAIIFPSMWHEPAGFISLEAATVSRAVISTCVGGIPEFANRLQNTLLVKPGDRAELAATIARLATEWELAKRLGQQGREQVAQYFGIHQHLEHLMQFYHQAMKRKTSFVEEVGAR